MNYNISKNLLANIFLHIFVISFFVYISIQWSEYNHFQICSLAVLIMTSAILTVQGYNLKSRFIWKEFTILRPGGEFEHYLLKPPQHCSHSDNDWKTVRYSTEHLHGLNYNDGFVSYSILEEILHRLKSVKIIYTYANVAKQAILKFRPHALVIDVIDLGLTLQKHSLDATLCGRIHSSRYCSRWQSFKVYDFLNDE